MAIAVCERRLNGNSAKRTVNVSRMIEMPQLPTILWKNDNTFSKKVPMPSKKPKSSRKSFSCAGVIEANSVRSLGPAYRV